MQTRIALLAGLAAVVGVTALALPDRQTEPRRGIVVVPAGSPALAPHVSPIATPAASADVTFAPMPDNAAAVEVDGVPADYPYWENGDDSVWASSAEFSGPE